MSEPSDPAAGVAPNTRRSAGGTEARIVGGLQAVPSVLLGLGVVSAVLAVLFLLGGLLIYLGGGLSPLVAADVILGIVAMGASSLHLVRRWSRQ